MSVSQIDPKLLMGQILPAVVVLQRGQNVWSCRFLSRKFTNFWIRALLLIPFLQMFLWIISWTSIVNHFRTLNHGVTLTIIAKLKICHFSPQHQWRHHCSARKRSNWHKSALKCIFVFCNWENLVNKTFWRAKCPSGQLAHHKSLLLKILEALLFATISATSLSAS